MTTSIDNVSTKKRKKISKKLHNNYTQWPPNIIAFACKCIFVAILFFFIDWVQYFSLGFILYYDYFHFSVFIVVVISPLLALYLLSGSKQISNKAVLINTKSYDVFVVYEQKKNRFFFSSFIPSWVSLSFSLLFFSISLYI